MAEFSYSYRPHVLSARRLYRLEPEGLAWSDGRRQGFVPYRDITQMRIYQARFLGSSGHYWNSVLRLRSGRTIRLGAAERAGQTIEDRTESYVPFIRELETRIAASNPQLRVVSGRHWLNTAESLGGWSVVLLMRLTRHLSLERSAGAAAWLMRKIGPRLRGHRTAAQQVAIAYPDKSPAEIEEIVLGMWDNLGRVAAEYAHLDHIWDFDPDRPEQGRIVADAATVERCRKLRRRQAPVLMFGAHIGNWEVAGLLASVFTPNVAAVYKAPRIQVIANELERLRKNSGGALLPADATTAFRIRDLLKRGHLVGMLVDEYYADGVAVTMFGKPFRINPLFARFVRIFECAFHGFYVERLPGSRFRLVISEAIEPRRDAAGKVDPAATMQAICTEIEGWVRAHPEQWMWLQRHWR